MDLGFLNNRQLNLPVGDSGAASLMGHAPTRDETLSLMSAALPSLFSAAQMPGQMPSLMMVTKSPQVAPDFVASPRGGNDWGQISQEAVDASNGVLKPLPIRVPKGRSNTDTEVGYGYDHIDPERLARLQKLGFSNADDFLDHVAQNHNVILQQPGDGKFALVVAPGRGLERGRPANNLMGVTLQDNGDHYGLTTIIPNATDSYLSSGGKSEIWRRGALPQTDK